MSNLDAEKLVSPKYIPRIFCLKAPEVSEWEAAHDELWLKAAADTYNCWGYFPDFNPSESTACRQFSLRYPEVEHMGRIFKFSFLRLSLKPQIDLGFHLDSNSQSGIGFCQEVEKTLKWRTVINYGNTDRFFDYSVQRPETVSLVDEGGLLVAEDCDLDYVTNFRIPPRTQQHLFAIAFCASEILHRGVDKNDGHFIAAYGVDEIL